jgi:Ca-activated chloride channel family protein
MYQFNAPQFLWLLLLFLPWSFYTFFKKRNFLEWTCSHLAVFLIILGLAGLEFGEEQSKKTTSGCRFFVALDVSKSMLADDVLPSRFHDSTKVLQTLLPEISCEIALFPFTTTGNLMIPPTNDNAHISSTLININPLDFYNQGTDFKESLASLISHIDASKKNNKQISKYAVLLLSDGESHSSLKEGHLSYFIKNRIPIHTYATGTQKGGFIQIEGKRILTKLDPLVLQKISLWTNGKFFTAKNIQSLAKEFTQDTISVETAFVISKNYSQTLFLLGFLLLCLSFLTARWEYAVRSLLFLMLLTPFAYSDEQKTDIELYNEAIVKEQDLFLPKAIEFYEEALNLTANNNLKRKILFNLGNTHFKMSEFDKALEYYQQAIDTEGTTPELKTISENIRLAYLKLKEQIKQQKQDKQSERKQQNSTIHDKEKIYKHIEQEEQQTQQRLNRNKKSNGESKTPW